MMQKHVGLVVGLALSLLTSVTATQSHFLNEWVAQIDGDLNQAHSIARRYGFQVVGLMDGFERHYILRHTEVPRRSKRSARHHTRRLTDDTDVRWAEQQFSLTRVRRSASDVTTTTPDLPFNDPELPNQWYLVAQEPARPYMSQVMEVWRQGWTGKGVVVTVVDDGLEHNNSDLADNYDPLASYDLNGNDPDPLPRYDDKDSNRHGTRCAGEVAMTANNSFCGVGIAFNCNIGGIRLLDGTITDRLEAAALSFRNDYIDVYSMSWGPTDDGKTVGGPLTLAEEAMRRASQHGRGGKGVVYVLASGNGGRHMDNCNCDGYAASIFTISTSSCTERGDRPWYGELCPSSLTTTYSSGFSTSFRVVSTDLRGGCTSSHSGTSASAPMVSAIVALTLEANPSLTWRDVQHLVVLASNPRPLAHNQGWYKNAAGLCVNLAFGFGLLDAEVMVTRAQRWLHVPPQAVCHVTLGSLAQRSALLPRQLTNGSSAEVALDTDGCRGEDNEVNFLEHVQFIFTLNYSTRGAVSVTAKSPSGTVTHLLRPRLLDNSTNSFVHWPLMSVHTWGENPAGTWIFRVEDEGSLGSNSGALLDVKMVLYGTKTAPGYRKSWTHCDLQVGSSTAEEAALEEFPLPSPFWNSSNHHPQHHPLLTNQPPQP
ncbi:neuroendocrine convertase 1-like [Babylonia areolata]|uniref:neuroendocrine convertase 1-like n=1 Tax=Babylonia areolata TaxID=304850 RepID=UPI003FCF43DD